MNKLLTENEKTGSYAFVHITNVLPVSASGLRGGPMLVLMVQWAKPAACEKETWSTELSLPSVMSLRHQRTQ